MAARITTRQLTALCHRLGTSLDAGLSMRRCWESEVDRAPGNIRTLYQSIAADLKAGSSLTDALARTQNYFPSLVHELVRVGEASGSLDQIFAGLSRHYAQILALRRNYLAGIAWPAIQLLMALVVIGVVILVTGMIAQPTGQAVDLLGLGLVGVSGFVTYVIIIVATVAGLSLMISAWSRGRFGATGIMRGLVHIPYLGECIRTFALSRFAWTLSLVTETSIDARRGMKLALNAANNSYYTRHADEIDRVIAAGRPMHEGLRQAEVFPKEFVEILATGEEAGKLGAALTFLARDYSQRAEMMSGLLTKLASFATWGIVALIIIFFIFRIASFYVGAIYDAAGL